MKKKVLSVLLAVCMSAELLPAISIGASAEGLNNTSTLTEFAYSTGTTYASGAVYRISGPESSTALSDAVNAGKTLPGVTIYLDDIVLNSGVTFTYEADASVEFSDAEGNWAKNAINDMASRKIICGYPDGTFIPNGSVTRAEFAALIVRAM
ncbi:MAG: S-layer homology domain-containing protein, partial [Oscillospiraceae bacterium]|nr:S-layer homology domain-containing protein [Oscillospiraceae bacterium]